MCLQGGSSAAEDKQQLANSRQIDRQLKAEGEALKEDAKITSKILLLGSGESGKSTILKQFRLIYGQGFSEDDIKSYRAAILGNVILCAKALVTAMDTLEIPYMFIPDQEKATELQQERSKILEELVTASGSTQDRSSSLNANFSEISQIDIAKAPKVNPMALYAAHEYNKLGGSAATPKFANLIKQAVVYRADDLSEDEIDAIKQLWNDSGVQYCFKRSNEYQILDSCSYFMNDLDRLADEKYRPTAQDILHTRVTTTGITENYFQISKDARYKILDVGGQRSERRKWAAHFQDVNAIFFLISIGAFDQKCSEDNETNRMIESRILFKQICNHPMFMTTSMIVFMNKIDILKEKLKTTQVSEYFPDYKGRNTYEETSEYFARKITALNKYPNLKNVYIYYSWTTDTSQIQTVFHTVNVILLQSQLEDVGMM